MHRIFFALAVLSLLNVPAVGQPHLAGHWLVTIQTFDATDYQRWIIEDGDGGRFTGTSGDQRLAGTVTREGAITIEMRDNAERPRAFRGQVSGEDLLGEVQWRGSITWQWKATRLSMPNRPPKMHVFAPQTFHMFFGGHVEPALRIYPKDTVRTSTIDVGGRDASGTRRAFNGSLTGPFLIEGAIPGDMLVVKLTRLRVNKDEGFTHGILHPNTVMPVYYDQISKDKPIVTWHIDRERDVAVLAEPSEMLKDLEIPLRPMLGMIGRTQPAIAFR